jgi:WD40 repeat protein
MDGSLRLWELADESEPEATLLLPENPEGAASGSFSPDDRFFLARLRAPGALLWDLHATEPVATRIPTGRLADACWSPDGRWFATATRDGHVLTWDPRRPLEPLTARELSQTATLLACSPDGRWLAASAGDDSVELWPSLDAARVERHRINGGRISALAFDASSRHLLLGTEDGTLSRWTPTFAFDRAPERVREQLRAASTACLSEQQRRWILLELPERARVAAERCERSYARLPAPP